MHTSHLFIGETRKIFWEMAQAPLISSSAKMKDAGVVEQLKSLLVKTPNK